MYSLFFEFSDYGFLMSKLYTKRHKTTRNIFAVLTDNLT